MTSLRLALASLLACIVSALAPVPYAAAADFYRPPMIGEIRHYTIAGGDTLLDLAVKFDVGYVELVAANPGVNPWVPKPGTKIVLPEAHLLPDTPHRGIVVNLAEMRLYYFPADAGGVVTFPLGIGVEGWATPLGTTQVDSKREHPTWIPPASIRAEKPELPAFIPPGPDNPLGDYALDLGWPRYLIHGTNDSYGVGRRTSHGCMRLYPEDIKRLFEWVPVGTPVTVVNQQAKVGWVGPDLYLEVHPSTAQIDELEIKSDFTPAPVPGLHELVRKAAGPQASRIDWKKVDEAARERRGIPVKILETS